MPIVSLRIHGREYQVACDEGQENRLRRLGEEVDERLQALKAGMSQTPSEAMGLLLSALMLADELFESKHENDKLAIELRRAQGAAQRARGGPADAGRAARLEQFMAETLQGVAERIEKIAERIEPAR